MIGEIDNIPVLSAGSAPTGTEWQYSSLSTEHNMSVILSVVFSEPNDEARHEIREFGLKNAEKNKTHDLGIRRETARYKWKNGTKAILQDDQVIIKGAELVNKEIIDSIASAEMTRLAHSWRDLTTGIFTQLDYKTSWVPSGSMRSVTIKFSARRGLETTFNMADRPPALDIFGLLPQSVRKVLYKQLSQD